MSIDHIPFAVIGISHHTAPVKVREALSLDLEEQKNTIDYLTNDENISGCMVLSTCNRTEIYLSTEDHLAGFDLVKSWFYTIKQSNYFNHSDYVYEIAGLDAVRHFFRVISSLDSQIVGETQITGQVKEAYNLAFTAHATDSLINKLFNFGIQAQKKVRNETYLCAGAISISFAGVELAEKIFNKLESKKVLLFGAGETAELAADHFRKKGVTRFNVINRTLKNAQILANTLNGRAFSLDQMEQAFEGVEIIISATASNDYVITYDFVREIVKKRKHSALFLIDIAVPRDIDPKIESLHGVYLYNLDDLQEIVKINTGKRKNEIPKALKAVDAVIRDFNEWFATYSVSSTIGKLKQYFTEICENEIKRFSKEMPPDFKCDLSSLKVNLTNKLVRQHVKLLKKTNGNPEHHHHHMDLIKDLFELDK